MASQSLVRMIEDERDKLNKLTAKGLTSEIVLKHSRKLDRLLYRYQKDQKLRAESDPDIRKTAG